MDTLEINKITDIDLDSLSKLKDIKNVTITDPNDHIIKSYSYNEFLTIKEIITYIKNSIHAESQKEIYSLVTLLLSKLIVFDTNIKKGDLQTAKDRGSLKCLLTRRGICEGIVDVMVKIMQEFNVTCYHQRGTSKDGAHSWTIVNLDGGWYEDDISNNILDIRKGNIPTNFLKGIGSNGKREFASGWIGQFEPYCYNWDNFSPSISTEETNRLLGRFGFKRKISSLIENNKKPSSVYETIDNVFNSEEFNNQNRNYPKR